MADLVKVSITGSLPGGEVWSINPVWRINAAPQTVTVQEAQAIVTAVNAIVIPTGFRNMMGNTTNVVGCRVEARTTAGLLETLAEGQRNTPVSGQGTTPHPFQSALVVSLRSPLAGASGRGRLYVPATGASLSSASLRLVSTDVTSYLAGVKSYLGLIQAAVTSQVPDSILAVWSRTLGTTLGVTRIQMGDVMDTQRRRRDQQIETFQELTFP